VRYLDAAHRSIVHPEKANEKALAITHGDAHWLAKLLTCFIDRACEQRLSQLEVQIAQ
jgi:hypothetical protein